jgi:hypothetical protein
MCICRELGVLVVTGASTVQGKIDPHIYCEILGKRRVSSTKVRTTRSRIDPSRGKCVA